MNIFMKLLCGLIPILVGLTLSIWAMDQMVEPSGVLTLGLGTIGIGLFISFYVLVFDTTK